MAAVWELAEVARGVAAQNAMLDGHLAAGAELVGWKVGVGAPKAMQTAGISAPLVGFLTTHSLLANGAQVAIGGWTQPGLEPEIAALVGADLHRDATPQSAAAAISGIGPAIELADVDTPLDELERVVAGNIYHRHVILGPADHRRAGGQTDGLHAHVYRDGHEIAGTDDVTELTGLLPALVAHVARWLGATGRRLQRGHVVICGSVVPIVDVTAGQRVEYRLGDRPPLQLAFTS